MHIYILPQCSTTAASVLNSAGMDAQFERSCCAISRGILRRMRPNHSNWTNKEVAAMPATNTATTTETKQTAEQIPQPKEPTKGFDPDSIRAFLKKLTQKK